MDSLGRSGLAPFPSREEQVDLDSMGRSFKQHVESRTRDAEPFFITATFSWRWSPWESARSYMDEEQFLVHLVGPKKAEKLRTEARLLRVDVTLAAGLEWGKPLPLPSKDKLAMWREEVSVRLNAIERLVPEKRTRTNRRGELEVLAWADEAPTLHVRPTEDGALVLDRAEIGAFQLITIPRRLDETRRPDEYPDTQLDGLFGRVRAAMVAWTQATDHLRPRAARTKLH